MRLFYGEVINCILLPPTWLKAVDMAAVQHYLRMQQVIIHVPGA